MFDKRAKDFNAIDIISIIRYTFVFHHRRTCFYPFQSLQRGFEIFDTIATNHFLEWPIYYKAPENVNHKLEHPGNTQRKYSTNLSFQQGEIRVFYYIFLGKFLVIPHWLHLIWSRKIPLFFYWPQRGHVFMFYNINSFSMF